VAKIVFTGEYYNSLECQFRAPGSYEVSEAKAKQLLTDFPDQFEVLEGTQKTPTTENPTKPLSKMNRAELEAVAGEIGLEVTDAMDTNKKLVAAIEVHQLAAIARRDNDKHD
jgi:hypothetical protein